MLLQIPPFIQCLVPTRLCLILHMFTPFVLIPTVRHCFYLHNTKEETEVHC